jgi:hypothetical protein
MVLILLYSSSASVAWLVVLIYKYYCYLDLGIGIVLFNNIKTMRNDDIVKIKTVMRFFS